MIDSARGLLPEARAELRQERAQYDIAPLPYLLGNLGADWTMCRLDDPQGDPRSAPAEAPGVPLIGPRAPLGQAGRLRCDGVVDPPRTKGI